MESARIVYIFSLISIVVSDKFRFASHYGDHMVLQRDPSRAIIWGFGETGSIVVVSLLGRDYKCHVTRDSRGLSVWKVVLDPIYASGPYEITAASTENGNEVQISLKDVYFGDVWICGGQSNMAFTVGMSFKSAEEIALAAKYTKVRLFTIKRYNSKVPVAEISKSNILQQWSVASKDSLKGYGWNYFSAVCWMYGRRLHDLYNIPIGLISTNYGGTSVEAWSSPTTLAECGIKDDQILIDSNDRNMHSGLWNAMLYPLLNTTIYGVIWYQGEQNAYQPQTYNCTFPALIRGWRNEWFDGTGGYSKYYFPFGFVQLSALGDDEVIDGFPVIRWKQTAEYGYAPNHKQLHTFMAVTMDLLDSNSPAGSIHPRDKTTVAQRLLLGARAIAYKEDVYWTGPIVDRVEVVVLSTENIKMIVVHYKSSSLQYDGIGVRSNRGFEVMFADSAQWTSVEITAISKTSVSMRLNQPSKTVAAVRYAWNQKPCLYKLCAIYAKSKDLPSPPFIKHGPFPTTHYWNAFSYKIVTIFVNIISFVV